MLDTRYRDVKVIAGQVLSLCPDDARVFSYVNRACQRLLYKGKWKGTIARYRICANSGCLVWPRQIETIEAYAVCRRPGTPRTGWFEFIGSGPGVLDGRTCAGHNLIDREDVCSFDNVLGTGKLLAVYCDKQEAAGATITIQYNDGGGNFVRKAYNGVMIDGERIALPPAGTYAYSTFTVATSGLLRVYKDETVGIVRLYEYDPITTLLRPLGYYAPDETTPIYRASELPGLRSVGSTTIGTSTCTGIPVEVRAKIRFIPVSDDDDFMVISYPEAIRLGCQAVLKEENGKFAEAESIFQIAQKALDEQLNHYRGSGTVAPVVFREGALPGVTSIV